jgi:hypothetical protein
MLTRADVGVPTAEVRRRITRASMAFHWLLTRGSGTQSAPRPPAISTARWCTFFTLPCLAVQKYKSTNTSHFILTDFLLYSTNVQILTQKCTLIYYIGVFPPVHAHPEPLPQETLTPQQISLHWRGVGGGV